MKHYYGLCAIALGSWEACAYLTRRCTVTRAVRLARHKFGRKADALILLWLVGLGVHLLREEKTC